MFTLKQTHRETGSMMIRMAQEKAVRSQPQMPMPTLLSWATRKKKSCRLLTAFSWAIIISFFLSHSSRQRRRHWHLWLASYCLLLGHRNRHTAIFPLCLFQGKNHCLDYRHPMHSVSFDWFPSGLEWILNLEFCLLTCLIFYQKSFWNICFSLIILQHL